MVCRNDGKVGKLRALDGDLLGNFRFFGRENSLSTVSWHLSESKAYTTESRRFRKRLSSSVSTPVDAPAAHFITNILSPHILSPPATHNYEIPLLCTITFKLSLNVARKAVAATYNVLTNLTSLGFWGGYQGFMSHWVLGQKVRRNTVISYQDNFTV